MAFDLQVHKRNAKGEVVSVDPYRLEINQGQKRYERPVGSGIWYTEGGQLTEEGRANKEKFEQEHTQRAEAKANAAAKAEQEQNALKAKAAQADAALAENAKLQAKLAELEKKAKA